MAERGFELELRYRQARRVSPHELGKVSPNHETAPANCSNGSYSRDNVMPLGSVPPMIALTRLGARNANEIVILTLRTLQRSRLAISSGFLV